MCSFRTSAELINLNDIGRMRRHRCGAVYSFPDSLIGSTTADIAGHRAVDIGVGWIRRFCQQSSGRHYLTGLTVTALWHVLFYPGLL
jgi:hypothetical protein